MLSSTFQYPSGWESMVRADFTLTFIVDLLSNFRLVILWGTVLALNCAVKNFASLLTLRILLGVFESVSAPSLILVVSMWYNKKGTWSTYGTMEHPC